MKLKLWIVRHWHRHGDSIYPLFMREGQTPDNKSIVEKVLKDFEERDDEGVEVILNETDDGGTIASNLRSFLIGGNSFEVCGPFSVSDKPFENNSDKLVGTVEVQFTSVWDDGVDAWEVTTNAWLDSVTGYVEAVGSKRMGELDILQHEYITLADGEEIPVCPDCHNHILKVVMIPNPANPQDNTLVEATECPDGDCPHNG